MLFHYSTVERQHTTYGRPACSYPSSPWSCCTSTVLLTHATSGVCLSLPCYCSTICADTICAMHQQVRNRSLKGTCSFISMLLSKTCSDTCAQSSCSLDAACRRSARVLHRSSRALILLWCGSTSVLAGSTSLSTLDVVKLISIVDICPLADPRL